MIRSLSGKEIDMNTLMWTMFVLAFSGHDTDARIEPQPQEIDWVGSYEEAMREGKSQKKLVLLNFYTDTCGWCQHLDAGTFPDAEVVKAARYFVPVRINAGSSTDVYEKYLKYVSGFPCTLFIDPESNSNETAVVGKIGGYMPARAFAARLNAMASVKSELGDLRKQVEAHPDDVDALTKLVVIHELQGDHDRAVALLKQSEDLKSSPDKRLFGPAYNAVADGYQSADKLEDAVHMSLLAAESNSSPGEVVYARLNAGFLYSMLGKPDEARVQFDLMAKTPGATEYERDLALKLQK
jgi:thioredoxin-related protein